MILPRPVLGAAQFSGETPPLFRHVLSRWWDAEKGRALVCMANPSYAGADKNDPTIWSLLRLLMPLPYIGGFDAVNFESKIATSPADLTAWRDDMKRHRMVEYEELFTRNLMLIRALARDARLVVVAWGNLVPPSNDATRVLHALTDDGRLRLYCFGETNRGAPKHPLARGKNHIATGTQPVHFPW